MKPPAIPTETHRDSFLAGVEGRKDSTPAFYQCHMTTRFDGWEVIVPLMFISLEEPHD